MRLTHWLRLFAVRLSFERLTCGRRPRNSASASVRRQALQFERLEERTLLATINLGALTAAQGTVLFGAAITPSCAG